jgi:hypothetical protein
MGGAVAEHDERILYQGRVKGNSYHGCAAAVKGNILPTMTISLTANTQSI